MEEHPRRLRQFDKVATTSAKLSPNCRSSPVSGAPKLWPWQLRPRCCRATNSNTMRLQHHPGQTLSTHSCPWGILVIVHSVLQSYCLLVTNSFSGLDRMDNLLKHHR